MLLEELSCISGVSGFEDEVRNFLINKIKGYVDEFYIDNIGNLIAVKKCKHTTKSLHLKLMLAAHMDEVGFMISGITKQGTLRFVQVGGIDERIIPGKILSIGKNKLPGITVDASINGNNLKGKQKQKSVTMEDLYIDIGAKNREDAKKFVEIGDYVSFKSGYIKMGSSTVKGKAFDDRAGCSILLEMLKGNYDFDLYACFTVQEEVGLRGAEVAAFTVKPDLAFVVEGTTCSDLSNVEASQYSTILGNGPAVSILDRTSYYDTRIVEFIKDVALKNNIKLQVKNTFTGGNDAGKIQKSNEGVRVAVLSMPVRYIHSPSSVMSLEDYSQMKELLRVILFEANSMHKEMILC